MKQARVVKGDLTAYFDVDDTLLMWSTGNDFDPASLLCLDISRNIWARPHTRHIDQLKQHAARGHTVVVWSQGGANWAANAVKLLGLEEHVDVILTKPTWYYDDKKAEEFMKERYYYEHA